MWLLDHPLKGRTDRAGGEEGGKRGRKAIIVQCKHEIPSLRVKKDWNLHMQRLGDYVLTIPGKAKGLWLGEPVIRMPTCAKE